jgi:hypothetical protein
MGAVQDRPADTSGREADREVLLLGAELRRPIARVAKLAHWNGSAYLVFGGLSLLLSLPTDFAGLAIGAVLVAIGLRERSQADALLAGDLDAPARLARGELLLMVAVIAYSLVQIAGAGAVGAELEEQLGPGLVDPGLVEAASSMERTVYVAFIAATVIYQGSMALRYRRVAPQLARYVAKVPEWAREVLASS